MRSREEYGGEEGRKERKQCKMNAGRSVGGEVDVGSSAGV